MFGKCLEYYKTQKTQLIENQLGFCFKQSTVVPEAGLEPAQP